MTNKLIMTARVSPDGKINPILPNTNPESGSPITPEDLRVEAGQEILFPNYKIKIYPPFGLEIFKIFVSEIK